MPRLAPAPAGRAVPISTVYVSGEIDILTGQALRRRLIKALPSSRGLFVLDVSAVAFCDAAGLSVLVEIQRRGRQRGVDLALSRPRPQMLRLLRITGLDRSIPVRV